MTRMLVALLVLVVMVLTADACWVAAQEPDAQRDPATHDLGALDSQYMDAFLMSSYFVLDFADGSVPGPWMKVERPGEPTLTFSAEEMYAFFTTLRETLDE